MNKRFLFFIAVFLVFVFVMQWKVPSQFVWNPTFSHGDSQPFGCLVFDSLMRRSVPAGYEVTRKTFAQLEREGYGRKPHAILVQAVGFQPTATDLRAMERLLKAGCKVFVATSYMDRDSLAVDLNVTVSGSSGFSPSWVRSSIENRSIPYDTLQWGCQPPYHEKAFPAYRAMSALWAEVDGAGPIRRFWSITIPQLRPIIVSMALLDLIWTSQQFALIWMTTGGGPLSATEMLSTFTYKLAFSEYDFAGASASAVIVLVLSMILAFFYVRSQRARD